MASPAVTHPTALPPPPLPMGPTPAPRWPLLVDLSGAECQRVLRSLDLRAYSAVLAALRARGDLSAPRRATLLALRDALWCAGCSICFVLVWIILVLVRAFPVSGSGDAAFDEERGLREQRAHRTGVFRAPRQWRRRHLCCALCCAVHTTHFIIFLYLYMHFYWESEWAAPQLRFCAALWNEMKWNE